jgi:hypothetical protein
MIANAPASSTAGVQIACRREVRLSGAADCMAKDAIRVCFSAEKGRG